MKLNLRQVLWEIGSSGDCEVAGIVLGIRMIIQSFQHCATRNLVEDVHMFCNCDSTIEAVDKMAFSRFRDTFRNLQKLLYQLQDMSVCV